MDVNQFFPEYKWGPLAKYLDYNFSCNQFLIVVQQQTEPRPRSSNKKLAPTPNNINLCIITLICFQIEIALHKKCNFKVLEIIKMAKTWPPTKKFIVLVFYCVFSSLRLESWVSVPLEWDFGLGGFCNWTFSFQPFFSRFTLPFPLYRITSSPKLYKFQSLFPFQNNRRPKLLKICFF